MKISIIIPTLNEEENLRSLLPYLFKHGGDNIAEIIVADAGSADNTLGIARKHDAIALNVDCKCRATQMNLGTQEATGEVLYYVHADSLPPETYTTDILNAIDDGYPIGCYRFKFDSNRWQLRVNSWFTRFDRTICRGGDQTLYVKRSIYEDLQGYDESYVIMEEYDFMRRARKKHNFRIIPKDVIVSARKYEKNSYLRVNLANLTVFTMFRFGASPTKIRDTYKRLINHPKA